MANPEHVKVVRQGAAAIAEWRLQNSGVLLNLTDADLSGADLSGADLAGAYLIGANLKEADLTAVNFLMANLTDANLSNTDLSEANLIGSYLVVANLAGADLSGANLTAANLFRADLTAANLTGADLSGANLYRAKLTKADLAQALLDKTSLGNCDLSDAALAAVNHEGPSSIGVDTLIMSFRGAGNKLTPDLETFFIGAGVPRELLTELPRIVAEVKYYSCFICYGQPDLDFATRLCDDLERRGVPCWLYDLDKTPGERTWPEISQARREADKMVVICSTAALVRDGALKEIEEQIDEAPDKIVPISRDNLWREPGFRVMRGSRDLGPWLRERNYADFSDESCYEDSLQRLLTALRRKPD
jgi:uncharacterized protein YjbI with pentapeptide repeats